MLFTFIWVFPLYTYLICIWFSILHTINLAKNNYISNPKGGEKITDFF